MVTPSFLITLIKCLKGHRFLGSPFVCQNHSVTRSPIELFWAAKRDGGDCLLPRFLENIYLQAWGSLLNFGNFNFAKQQRRMGQNREQCCLEKWSSLVVQQERVIGINIDLNLNIGSVGEASVRIMFYFASLWKLQRVFHCNFHCNFHYNFYVSFHCKFHCKLYECCRVCFIVNFIVTFIVSFFYECCRGRQTLSQGGGKPDQKGELDLSAENYCSFYFCKCFHRLYPTS